MTNSTREKKLKPTHRKLETKMLLIQKSMSLSTVMSFKIIDNRLIQIPQSTILMRI